MESATSMVVESGLSALFQGLLEKLRLLFGVNEEAKKLKDVLPRIQSYLNDAEDRQIKDESVRLWLTDLKDSAYDAEDILDELEYMLLRSKVEEEAPTKTRKRKLAQVYDLYSRVSSNLDLGSRSKEIRERLEAIANKNNSLHLKVMYESERLKPSRERPPTSSIVDESIVFAREADREKLVGLVLTSDDESSAGNDIRVIPICGMGGLGKTTLAQLVYNDGEVAKHFEVRAWVYVSQVFDLLSLTKEIAKSVSGNSFNLTNFDNFNAIQVSIKEVLREKRFLLVLDDVWNDNRDDCDALLAPLMNGARGSRILVTTRSLMVSSNMGTVPTQVLQGLSEDECWSLFERRAFVEGNSDAHPELKKLGKQIVSKCKGLPLVVKTLGGLLRSKVDVDEWEAILKSKIWDLPEERNNILPALRLSYHHLPAHLKRCFAYCCIFRKGFKMTGDEFVLMWMAQGFIQSEGSKQMEDIGREYLADLVSRSLLNYNQVCYSMHDLTHDLAGSVLGAEFLELGDVMSHKNVEKARHVSNHLPLTKAFNFEHLCCLKSLRTLIFVEYPTCINNILTALFVNSKHIRSLNLMQTSTTELPDSVENLIHLRHLDLSGTSIERLPKSITRLYHLQTLILQDCFKLVELPSELSNLVSLRHLNLRGTSIERLPKSATKLYHLQTLILQYCSKLVELPSDLGNLVNLRHLPLVGCPASIPPNIGRLTNLQTLQEFNVGREIGCGINELKDMTHLRGQLSILKLENVVNAQEAKEMDLKRKQKIDSLSLCWKFDSMKLRQEGNDKEVLQGLQPHTNLEKLLIIGYCGSTFPRWLGNSSFSNLAVVSLFNCRCHFLPSFGRLPALKSLQLCQLYGLEKVGREFYGDGTVKSFPSLQSLQFSFIHDLKEWLGLEGGISHIGEIIISNCSKLRGLAFFPLASERVRIENCERLATLSRISTIRDLTLCRCDAQVLSSLQDLTSLSSLKIIDFPNLTSLPNGSLQPLIALEKLTIGCFNQLMSLLEEVGLQLLTSLQALNIYKCSKLTTMGDKILPATLLSLKISDCDGLKFLPEVLPPTLLSLVISNCKKLECLPKVLPPTLLSLGISNCDNLKCLPTELPTSLQSLCIGACPLLREKKYRCKISHIPRIIIDGIDVSSS